MLIRGMNGLGDCIYQRAFIRKYSGRVFLETPWPELYQDMRHVQVVRPATQLRTQAKNIERCTRWRRPPPAQDQVVVRYGGAGIFNGMRSCFGFQPGQMDLPDFGPSPVSGHYVVVRPVTVRSEWVAESRNPDPLYVAQAAAEIRRRGYQVVSVADLEPGREWAVEPLPQADISFHRGELPVEQLLALLQHAAAVIGGIGWILPAAIAARVPAWIVCGGQGGFNHPRLLTDRTTDLSLIEFAVPDEFCLCTERDHPCNKRISNHDQRFAAWADRLPALV